MTELQHRSRCSSVTGGWRRGQGAKVFAYAFGEYASTTQKSLALRLAQEVQAILQIEKLPFDMTPDVFLEGVYVSYQAEQEQFEA